MTQTQLDDIKKKVIPILKAAGVKRSSLFGSVVRGEATKKSDIDILVEFSHGKTLFDFVDLELKLEDILGRKVDLGEFGTIKPRIKDQVLKQQVRIL